MHAAATRIVVLANNIRTKGFNIDYEGQVGKADVTFKAVYLIGKWFDLSRRVYMAYDKMTSDVKPDSIN